MNHLKLFLITDAGNPKALISTIQNINITNSFVFSIVINLSRHFDDLKTLDPENNYYDKKRFMDSLLEIFSGRSFMEGQRNDDPMMVLIKGM